MLSKIEREIISEFVDAEWNSEEMHRALGELITMLDMSIPRKGVKK